MKPCGNQIYFGVELWKGFPWGNNWSVEKIQNGVRSVVIDGVGRDRADLIVEALEKAQQSKKTR